jgi:O-6-methylguanine DNA methyltransferase
LADSKGIIRTVLPTKNYKTAKKYLLVGMFKSAREDKALYPQLQRSIRAYYERSYIDFEKLKLFISLPQFSDFAVKVLKVCTQIPAGKMITYAQLAKKAGFPKAGRAVGNVLAKNPLPLIIPCHRVIRADGKIGKFSAPGGSRIKNKMLEHEKCLG